MFQYQYKHNKNIWILLYFFMLSERQSFTASIHIFFFIMPFAHIIKINETSSVTVLNPQTSIKLNLMHFMTCWLTMKVTLKEKNNKLSYFSSISTSPASFKRITCQYCDKTGHTTKVCYKLHGYPPKHNTGPLSSPYSSKIICKFHKLDLGF